MWVWTWQLEQCMYKVIHLSHIWTKYNKIIWCILHGRILSRKLVNSSSHLKCRLFYNPQTNKKKHQYSKLNIKYRKWCCWCHHAMLLESIIAWWITTSEIVRKINKPYYDVMLEQTIIFCFNHKNNHITIICWSFIMKNITWWYEMAQKISPVKMFFINKNYLKMSWNLFIHSNHCFNRTLHGEKTFVSKVIILLIPMWFLL